MEKYERGRELAENGAIEGTLVPSIGVCSSLCNEKYDSGFSGAGLLWN